MDYEVGFVSIFRSTMLPDRVIAVMALRLLLIELGTSYFNS